MYPIIFQSKYFTLNTYWLFFVIAIVIGVIVLVRLIFKNGLKLQFLSEHGWKMLLLGIIGARLGGILSHASSYFTNFSQDSLLRLFYIWDKAFNVWVGAFIFFLYLYKLSKKHEQDFWKWIDVFVPVIILIFGISSLGGFFEGINYGRETFLPWGVNFESPAIKYTVPIHPSQIYAFLYSIALSIGLIFLSNHKKIKKINLSGLIGLLGISLYSFLRFLEGFTRGDDTYTLYDIRVPQIIFIVIAISTIIGGRKYLKNKYHESN
jgi:phosphatidylglycerol---prolipoprotein diacylglyceryl transferase